MTKTIYTNGPDKKSGSMIGGLLSIMMDGLKNKGHKAKIIEADVIKEENVHEFVKRPYVPEPNENPFFGFKSKKAPKKMFKCHLPGCEIMTDHNAGYCSALHFKMNQEIRLNRKKNYVKQDRIETSIVESKQGADVGIIVENDKDQTSIKPAGECNSIHPING